MQRSAMIICLISCLSGMLPAAAGMGGGGGGFGGGFGGGGGGGFGGGGGRHQAPKPLSRAQALSRAAKGDGLAVVLIGKGWDLERSPVAGAKAPLCAQAPSAAERGADILDARGNVLLRLRGEALATTLPGILRQPGEALAAIRQQVAARLAQARRTPTLDTAMRRSLVTIAGFAGWAEAEEAKRLLARPDRGRGDGDGKR